MSNMTEEERSRTLELIGKNLKTICHNKNVELNKKLYLGQYTSKLYFDILMHVGKVCYKSIMKSSCLHFFKLYVERKPLWDFYSEYKFKLYIRFYPGLTQATKFKRVKKVLSEQTKNQKKTLTDKKRMLAHESRFHYEYCRYNKYVTDLFLLKMILEPLDFTIEQIKQIPSYYLTLKVVFPTEMTSNSKQHVTLES